jgi:cytochrome c oxidase assembly protein subunit 15
VNITQNHLESRWPHRWAVALVCATFPLIWIGGLVTTYDAGMAVPDWPNTYGYNLFLYPWQTWVYGPWGLFIEHGHRLMGSLVGMITIGLVVSCWCCTRDRVLRALSLLALGAVIFQGALGGLRVIQDQVQLAKIHGCFGPAFFALAVALATMTSERWKSGTLQASASLAKIERLAVVTTLLAYCQLVLGAQLRHLPAGAEPSDFRIALVFHLATAAALVVHVGLLAWAVLRTQRSEPALLRPTIGLSLLIALHLVLGCGTWVVKYGWPSWLADYDWAAGYTVTADGGPAAWLVTAHVATGSLILVTSLLVALRSVRFAWRGSRGARLLAEPRLAEAAR